MIATAIAIFLIQAAPSSVARPVGSPDPLYVVEGSVVESGETALATVVVPLDDQGLMSMRVEMDCARQRYRPVQVTFYNKDGSLRNSTGPDDGDTPGAGWSTRNVSRISDRVCR